MTFFLSDKDRDLFLKALKKPSPPNENLKKAFEEVIEAFNHEHFNFGLLEKQKSRRNPKSFG